MRTNAAIMCVDYNYEVSTYKKLNKNNFCYFIFILLDALKGVWEQPISRVCHCVWGLWL